MSTKRSGKDAEKDGDATDEEPGPKDEPREDASVDDDDWDDDEDSDDEDSDDEDSDDEDSDDEDSDDEDSDDEDSDDDEDVGETAERESKASKSPKTKSEDEDEDDWDEDDWDEDDDDLGDGRHRGARKASKPVDDAPEGSLPKRRARQAATVGAAVATEEEIDSPTMQTLGMLSILAAATLVMWGVGRASCNFREVGEGMRPRDVALEERTRDPKSAAFEFQYALGTHDFESALKVSKGAAKRIAERKQEDCRKRGDACKKEQEELSGKVFTVAELLKRAGTGAVVRAWSEGSDDANKKYLMILARDGKDWKVTSYRPDNGKVPDLPGADRPPPGLRDVAPGGSANPMREVPGLPERLRRPVGPHGTATTRSPGSAPGSRPTTKPAAPKPQPPTPRRVPAPRPAAPAPPAPPTPPAQ